MKVRRVLEYEGTKDWVEVTLARSYVKGRVSNFGNPANSITEVSVEVVEEIKPDFDGLMDGEDMMETKEARIDAAS